MENLICSPIFGLAVLLMTLLVAYFLIININCFAEKRITENQESAPKVMESVSQFMEILFYINLYYYKKVDIEKCAEQIIQKGLSEATDRYSYFITKDQIEKLESEFKGHYEGIGLRLIEENGEIKVHSVFADSLAEKSGILPGDMITAISPTGKKEDLVSGSKLNEIHNLMRGKKGAKILLSISRNGRLLNIEVERGNVKDESVIFRKPEEGIGYVKITKFIDATKTDFKSAVDSLEKDNVKVLIMDLRNNPGGSLGPTIDILAFFKSDEKPIVYLVNQNNPEVCVYPEIINRGIFCKLKVVVLVNKRSASATEIISGWFKEDFGAPVVGEATFGKDCGQGFYRLSNGNFLCLTAFKYLIGEKKVCIGKTGVTPTIEIKNSDNQEDKTDYQMRKALETARKLLVH